MTSRLLHVAEWTTKLQGTELAPVIAQLPTRTTQVLVVEDGDQVVACWALLPVYHVEGLWIHPDHRGKSSAARRLWGFLKNLTRLWHIDTVITAANSDQVRGLLEHVGAQKLPDSYVLRMN